MKFLIIPLIKITSRNIISVANYNDKNYRIVEKDFFRNRFS